MEAIWDFIGNILVALGILFTTLSAIFVLVSGLVSVYFGRRLFWVFVATLGFMIGLLFSDNVLAYLPPALEPFQEFIRLGFAILVAFIALGLQRFGIVLAGGIAVGVLGYYIAGQLDVSTLMQWGAAAVCGLLAAALLWFSHDWMLIIITAVTGSLIGVVGANQINPLPEGTALWIYLILVITGVLYQYRDLGKGRKAAVLVAAPSDSKPSARTRLPFLRRDAEAIASTPVTLIESTAPAMAVAASTSAPTPSPATQTQPPVASAITAATIVAASSAPANTASPAAVAPSPALPATPLPATPLPATPLPATPLPATPLPVTPLPAMPLPTTPVAVAAALAQPASASTPGTAAQATALPAPQAAKATKPATAPLPAAPAPTTNVDGQIVVLSSRSDRWLRVPRWQKASQAAATPEPTRSAESVQQPPKPFFKSAPEAYG